MLLPILIFVQSCIANPDRSVILINRDTLSSQLNIPSGSFVYVGDNVTLTVDTTLLLQQCEVVMGANSKIVVNYTDTLEITGSYLHGCQKMWDGIYAVGGATVMVQKYVHTRSTIEDAMNGIVASLYSTKMYVTGTDFNRNQYSIKTLYYGFDSTGYNISDCYFGMGNYNSMLPAPSGYANYNRPLAGIEIKFSAMALPNPRFTGNKPNKFEKMNCGIKSYWSTANVYNNYFEHIRNTETNSAQTGAAVYATGNGTWNPNSNLLVNTSTTVPSADSVVHFSDCDYGVYTNVSKVNVVRCRMDSVTHCIKTMNSVTKVWVSDNYLTNTNYGITLNNNAAAENRVWNNHIDVNAPTSQFVVIGNGYGLAQINTYGVYETEINQNLPVNSSIYSNSIYDGRNCIWLNNADGTQVYQNQLHQHSTTAVIGSQAGLYTSNSMNLRIEANSADGNGSVYYDNLNVGSYNSTYRKSGYSFYGTTGEFCSNTADSVGYASYFAADCMGMNVRSNTYGKSKFAMVLKSSGIANVLGEQGYENIQSYIAEKHQNEFIGTGNNHSFDNDSNFRTYSFINTGNLYFPPALYYIGDTLPSNAELSDLSGAIFNGSPNKQYAIQAIHIDSNYTILPYQCAPIFLPFIHPWDLIVAGGNGVQYMEPGYAETGNWLAKRKLFNQLRSDTALLNADTLLQNFYAANIYTAIGEISDYEQQLKQVNDSTTLSDSLLFVAAYNGADSLRKQIVYTNIPEENFSAMHSIYLNRLGNMTDTFYAAQLTALRNIALQCPYIAGDAVYVARTLLAQVDDRWFFDDVTLCDYTVSYKKDNGETGNNKKEDTIPARKEFVKVFPNPANRRLNVLFEAKLIGKVKFELMDVMGQILKTVTIQEGANYITFDVGDLPSSMYLWRLRDKARAVASGTVAIQR